jgi:CRP/FNR family transcriptional regulator, cyclic AMP receptor protein
MRAECARLCRAIVSTPLEDSRMITSPLLSGPPEPFAALSGSWFGAGLSPEATSRLAGIAEIREVPAGTELTNEGELTRALAIVLSGRVALRMLVPERGMITILTVEPGDVVGWSAILPPHRSTAACIAIEPCRLLELPGEALRGLLRADHALAASVYPRVLQAVGRRLAATRLQLLDLFAREEWGRREIQPW